jgi:peptidyl-prolyl cis-trans isomerase B (cyclophilin B)
VLRLLASVLCVLALGLVACGDDDDSGSSDDGGSSGAASTSGSEQPREEEQAPEGEPPTERARQGRCRDVQAPAPRQDGGAKPPRNPLEEGKTYVVTLRTSCGTIGIRLDQGVAPKTAASFANLARTGFYDGTTFHRIVPGFVIQGGDPTGTGTGGPGYSTRDVPPRDTAYLKGTVAMAKSPTEPPGTSGSQFYIVTAPDAGLPPEYALLGTVVRGMEVVDAIGRLGDPASGGAGTPLQPVVIQKASVAER